MKLNKYWDIKCKVDDPETGELYLYGDISSEKLFDNDVTPTQLKADLDAMGDIKNLNIYVNSGGGNLFASMTIYNIIKRHTANKTAYVDGIAASGASIIIMGADRVVMPINATIVIHNAMAAAFGNKNGLRKMADDLDKVDETIVSVYAEKTGMDSKQIAKMMDKESWLTAKDAIEMGFADEMQAENRVSASINGTVLTVNNQQIDLQNFKNAPAFNENGVETQPISDIISAQNQHFQSIKTKLLNI